MIVRWTSAHFRPSHLYLDGTFVVALLLAGAEAAEGTNLARARGSYVRTITAQGSAASTLQLRANAVDTLSLDGSVGNE